MTDALGTTTYQYDDMQRLISTTDVNDKTVSYEYDILGRKTSQTLPDGQTVGYTYDVMDRLTKVYENDALLAEYEYDKNSQLIENNRNELKTTYEYDALGQLTEMTTVKGYEDIMNFTYEYDKIGNITSETRKEGDSTHKRKYLYDGANQLVAFADNEYSETYSYDNAGNMLEKVINDTATSYSYNTGNQLIKELTNGSEIGYNYNANGDMISKTTGEDYTYDIMGNLTSIIGNGINQSFTYNGSGHRMSKTDDGETIHYVNDINLLYEQVLQTYADDGNLLNTYTYGLERIQSKGKDNETYLYDGRGSVVGAINQDNILENYSYTAYGELMPTSPQPKVWGYNGEAQDSKTGMQYLRARHYDTQIAHFFQEDDYTGNIKVPVSQNRYMYVFNNPIMRADPSGYYPSGMPSDIQKIVKKREAKKKSEQYIKRYSNPVAPTPWSGNSSGGGGNGTDSSDGGSGSNSMGGNLIHNPYPIGPALITQDEYVCLGAAYNNVLSTLSSGMDMSTYTYKELMNVFDTVVKYQDDLGRIFGDERIGFINDLVSEVSERDRIFESCEEMRKYRDNMYDIVGKLYEQNGMSTDEFPIDEPDAYYIDSSISGGIPGKLLEKLTDTMGEVLKVVSATSGQTTLVDFENEYVGIYDYKGFGVSWSMFGHLIDAKKSKGTISGDTSNPENYTGGFIAVNINMIRTHESGISTEKPIKEMSLSDFADILVFGVDDGRMQQYGEGWTTNIGIDIMYTDYDLVEVYKFEQLDIN